jgi:deoxyribodipyrimidine photo-lyase
MRKKALFIFRRDMRYNDNTGLAAALASGYAVIPCFIINPEQVGAQNPYRGQHALQFMIESLKELHEELRSREGKLYFFYGKPQDVVERLIKQELIAAVYVNKDYTPYSRKRDTALEQICAEHGADWNSFADALLIEPEDGVSKSGKPYEIFTPFFRKNSASPIELLSDTIGSTEELHRDVSTHHTAALYNKPIAGEKELPFLDTLIDKPISLYTAGGRSSAIALLKKLPSLAQYGTTHDIPSVPTSNLSAHNKFGTVSIREVYHAIASILGKEHLLIRQLYWRDFFYHIAWFYPHVFGQPFHREYEDLSWSENEHHFKRWCEGTTGFPIVDAGMRQMNETGFMHNRVRMVVASFLVKDLHINWLWGERYFAQLLEDYDPAVNNGNWQWVASTGCDHQPYFRVFNPWLQQKKFDPECIYIKEWIPELRSYDAKLIHKQATAAEPLGRYPAPMISHQKEAALAIKQFRSRKKHA